MIDSVSSSFFLLFLFLHRLLLFSVKVWGEDDPLLSFLYSSKMILFGRDSILSLSFLMARVMMMTMIAQKWTKQDKSSYWTFSNYLSRTLSLKSLMSVMLDFLSSSKMMGIKGPVPFNRFSRVCNDTREREKERMTLLQVKGKWYQRKDLWFKKDKSCFSRWQRD